MLRFMRTALGTAGLAVGTWLAAGVPVQAQITDDVVRIGVLNDQSGPFADLGGPGSVAAAKLAVEERGGRVLGKPVDVVAADTQNKPDVASGLARRWFDQEKVDAIVDLPVTAIAAAVQAVAKEKNKTVMIAAGATSDFTAKTCSPTSTHWTDDTHALTAGTAKAIVENGGKSWFFITVDHAFGTALQKEATDVVAANGGKIVGSVRHPLGMADYSSLLLQAQASGASVVALASVGGDLVNLIKQAHEFGLTAGGQTLAGFLVYITDVHALGIDTAQGLTFTEGFYWNRNDESREFARRFAKAMGGSMPSKTHAAVYAAVRHYLAAIERAGTDEAVAANRAMREMPVDYFGPAKLRSDGRVLYDLTLYRVKAPADVKLPWDYYQPVAAIPSSQAFLPASPECTRQE
jgi:branched-chain amino acid transport system substrate-binding protein